jgi:hypothetical protein
MCTCAFAQEYVIARIYAEDAAKDAGVRDGDTLNAIVQPVQLSSNGSVFEPWCCVLFGYQRCWEITLNGGFTRTIIGNAWEKTIGISIISGGSNGKIIGKAW